VLALDRGASMADEKVAHDDDCVFPPPALPAEELGKYSVERDPHLEREIARYIELEAEDEIVKHVEKVKNEVVIGELYEIWDVTTNKERWWVITNPTNLYSQRYFPSLDYTLSFHIGLMMRLRSRPAGPESHDPSPFDDVFRRQEQAKNRFDTAVEAEDYQAVGMQLRECLISLVAALRRRVDFDSFAERPQDANFVAWSALLMDELCAGSSNKELRQYLKGTARDAWQLVNWLTHDRNANKTACSIAIHGCDAIVGHFVQILQLKEAKAVEVCPVCNSRKVRSHFDAALGADGEYYNTCAVCEWSGHPGDQTSEQLGMDL
jgi:hypothetical protein